MKNRHAFTLIEMLVVIAIIGIVAAMVVSMGAAAKVKQHNAQVNGAKQSLTLMIDSYQAKLNYYPPDNGMVASQNLTPAQYDGYAATNPLLYELTGATPAANNTYITFDNTIVPALTYTNFYNRTTINNSNPDEPHNFFVPGPQPKDYTNYVIGGFLKGLLVPVSYSSAPGNNFWHYDSSSTNRHNLQSYDLWAEYATSGTNIATNGNW